MARRYPKVGDFAASLETDPPVLGLLPASILAHQPTLPVALSQLLQKLDGQVSSVEICKSLASVAGNRDLGLGAALIEVAANADRSGLKNAYHNPTHSRDVGVIFANLARLEAKEAPSPEPLTADDFLTGCCAAFGHDIGHDGTEGGPEAPPFRLERIAADTVCAIMLRHGAAPHLIDRARCAILATDVYAGYRALEQSSVVAAAASGASPLRGLSEPHTHETACMLRDADVMQSAGLTPEDHDRQTARLEKERGMPTHAMGVRGADFFLKDVIKGRFLSAAGRLFQPRLDHLLKLNALRAQRGQGADGLAAFDKA